VLVRDLISGKKVWEQGINRIATIIPDSGGSGPETVWLDPWTSWEQTTQLLPVTVVDGKPGEGFSLPPACRLVAVTKSHFVVLDAQARALVALRRTDKTAAWKFPVDRSVFLSEGLYWCDGIRAGFLSGQEVKVVELETGKETLTIPMKKGTTVTAMWIEDQTLAVATTREIRLYTLGGPSN
jgi:hypothetical protein